MTNKNNYLLIGVIVVAVVILAIVFVSNSNDTNTIIETKYVCSNGSVVESSSSCSIDSSTQTASKNYDYFNVELDGMGATGKETQGFGDGWLDSEDCLNSNYAQGKTYTNCNIQDVQILTGSDPNPLKINNGGTIFNNGVIFKIKCACS